LAVVVFLILNLVAIGLGRIFPERPSGRALGPVAGVSLNAYACRGYDDGSAWFLDARTGLPTPLARAREESLDLASWSPWRDERGNSQVVARWIRRSGQGQESVGEQFGLARQSFPGGEVLDRIETSIVPAAPPCWYPDTTARVLFPGGDGQIYRFAFETPARTPSSSGAVRRAESPVPLEWRCPLPGAGSAYVFDVCWPPDSRLRGLLLATVSVQHRIHGRLCYGPPALYWLRLDRAGTAIEDSGLIERRGESFEDRTERMPAVSAVPGGPLVIACMTRRVGSRHWDLETAALRVDPRTGIPTIEPGTSRVLARNCAPTPPAFSSNGQWIACICPDESRAARVRRIAVQAPGADES
jgi:hypothetical protein